MERREARTPDRNGVQHPRKVRAASPAAQGAFAKLPRFPALRPLTFFGTREDAQASGAMRRETTKGCPQMNRET